jgi:cytoskeletal protein CcmA (bactofilin family)
VEKIIIRKEAHLVGDLKSASISIEDGAYFKGSIDIVRPVPAKPAAPTPPASLPLSPPPSPPSAGQGKTVSQSSKPAPLPGARKPQT